MMNHFLTRSCWFLCLRKQRTFVHPRSVLVEPSHGRKLRQIYACESQSLTGSEHKRRKLIARQRIWWYDIIGRCQSRHRRLDLTARVQRIQQRVLVEHKLDQTHTRSSLYAVLQSCPCSRNNVDASGAAFRNPLAKPGGR